jgi:putative transposase
MCTRPGDYRWSSYRTNALGEQVPWLAPQALYESLGDSTSARCKAYTELFEDGLDEKTVDIIRTF